MMNLHDLYDAAMSVSSKQKAESTLEHNKKSEEVDRKRKRGRKITIHHG